MTLLWHYGGIIEGLRVINMKNLYSIYPWLVLAGNALRKTRASVGCSFGRVWGPWGFKQRHLDMGVTVGP